MELTCVGCTFVYARMFVYTILVFAAVLFEHVLWTKDHVLLSRQRMPTTSEHHAQWTTEESRDHMTTIHVHSSCYLISVYPGRAKKRSLQ